MRRAQRNTTDGRTATRRAFLGGLAAASLFGVAGSANAQEGTRSQEGTTATPTVEYQLGAQVSGWTGQKPPAIEGEENPTLRLEAGRTYTVSWVNLDGQQHQLQIRGPDGETVAESDVVATQGATGAVEFEAGPETVSYRCSIHTTSMQGTIQVAGGVATTRGAAAEPGTEGTRAASETATSTSPSTPSPTTRPTTSTTGTTGEATTDGGTTTGGTADPDGDELEPVETPAPGGQPGFGVAAAAASFLVAGLARLARGGD